ncbi:MAG: hypothetical protein WD053_09870 [Gracilimonas sp.]
MENNKPPIRDRIAIIAAPIFIIGGGILLCLLYLEVIDHYFPELNQPHDPTVLELLIAFTTIIGAIIIGIILGLIVYILLARPFFNKEELLSFAKPEISYLSEILRRFIHNLYST